MKTIEKKRKKLTINQEKLRLLTLGEDALKQIAGGRKAGGSTTCDCF